MLRNAMGVGGVSFPGKKRYEGVMFNVISITREWVGVKFPGIKRYVTLEWPLRLPHHYGHACSVPNQFWWYKE